MAKASKRRDSRAENQAPKGKSKGRIALGLGLGLGAALLAIGALGTALIFQGSGTDGPKAWADASVPVGTEVGRRAPDFALADVDGNPIRLEELRGRPTVVYFSAAWCTSCIPQTKELAKLKAEYRDRLNVVWIDVNPGRDTVEDLRAYMVQYGHEDFLVAFDTLSNEVARRYRVRALGETYLLDEQGIIVQSGVGIVFSERFRQTLQDLARRTSSSE